MKKKMNSQIKAKATAREFPSFAFPLKMVDNTYARDEQGHLIITDGNQILKPLKEVYNTDMFVTVGKYWLGDMILGVTSGSLTHIGTGGSATAPTVNDTDLISNVGTRHLYTDRFRTTNVDTLSTFFSAAENNGTWNETGLFTGASGTLFCRSTFGASVSKTSSNTQTIDFDITIT